MWADDEKGALFDRASEAPKGVVGRNGTGQPYGHSLCERRTFPTLYVSRRVRGMSKKFLLRAEDIQEIAPGLGACYASDHITVEGRKVGFMYREEPDNDVDSGWRFLSGSESQEYLDDSNNLQIYDVNTIANYDQGVVAFLSAPSGSAFARTASGEFVADEQHDDDDV
jgi:hypothetical protein